MSKIILDCDLMKHKYSGLYYYCLNLGRAVKKILDEVNRDKISFYVPPEERNSFGTDASCIIEKKWHQKYIKPFLWDCNIWHAPFQSGRILPKKNKGLKVVLTIHDLNQLHEGKSLEEQEKSTSHTQRLIDQSDAIVCISEFTKGDVLNNCEVGNKPVYVIHNGVENIYPSENFTPTLKPLNPFLFGMGYVNAKKNFHVLLPLLKHNPQLEMVIAGKLDEPDYITQMHNAAQSHGIANRLHVTGPISENEKAWYLSNCLAFMHPSLAEGFGAPVVEAMRYGKPLFLSHRTSLPEIGGDAAFYFSSFEEHYMQRIFREGMERFSKEEMAPKVMLRGKSFDWAESAKKYIKVYHSLL